MTRHALILAHGQPSDPRTAGAALEALAARVQALLPGWAVGAATLAEDGALERCWSPLAATLRCMIFAWRWCGKRGRVR